MRRHLVLGGLAATLLAGSPSPAATFIVTNTNDSGTGSLRWAIEQANATAGSHQIRVNNGGNTVITYRPLTELPRIERNTEVFSCCRLGTRLSRLNTIIDGSLMAGSGFAGLRLGDNVTVEGVIVSGFRDGAGGAAGIRMEGTGSQLTHVFVGTSGDGTGADGNDTGVEITGSGNSVGYDFEDDRQQVVVSGNGVGVAVRGGSGNVIQQAWIGLGITRAPLPNTSHGVVVDGGSGTRLGRPGDPTLRPIIAFNGGAGLLVTGAASLGHGPEPAALVYENGGLAIDLGGDGATANDPGDADDGPNGLQNFPVISTAAWSGATATVSGTLSSKPSQTYAVDFYAARDGGPSGRGRAERFLNRVQVTTDASGQASFSAGLYGAYAAAPVLSATATDAQGNVSELSPGVQPTGPAPAAPALVVNVTDDVESGWCSVPHCSLRQAILAANLSPPPTPQRTEIHFGIPGPGPHFIEVDLFLPVVTQPVVIDGYTQPGSSPNTRPVGQGLDTVLRVTVLCDPDTNGGLSLADDSVVRGLAFNRCTGAALGLGSRNVVEGCFVGLDASGASDPRNLIGVIAFGSDNRIGGTTPAARNLISGSSIGVELHPAESVLDPPTAGGNVVQGNLIGTTADGHSAHPNRFAGVAVSAANGKTALFNVIGGTEPAARNVISGQDCPTQLTFCRGVDLFASSGTVLGTMVQGNYIGTDVEGDDPLPNEGGVVIDFPGANNNVVGGGEAGAANVISGNSSSGVALGFGTLGNRIERNVIGPTAAGTAVLGNGDEGIAVGGSFNVLWSNTIRGSGTYGISVFDGRYNQFWRNSISGSALLGLDLGFDGVTPNDPLDADAGENDRQNFPVLTAAVPGTTVSGTMPGAPNRELMLEFFAGPGAHPSGFGEGQRLLGSRMVTTDASGAASFNYEFTGSTAAGEAVSATATDSSGNTSEFSRAVTVVEPLFRGTALAVDTAGNGVLEPGENGVVSPTWRNGSGAAAALTGTVTSLGGPAGPQYTRIDASAAYGTVGNGAQASCTATGDCYRMQVGLPAGRPQLHLDAQMSEQTSGGGTRTWPLHVGGSFADVPVASPFYRFVETLLHRGVTAGCGGASYCAAASTSRQEMAVFVLTALEGAGYRPLACGAGLERFPDVPATSPYCRWIQELARRRVVSGCGGGLYCPTAPVTREQMAVFVLATREGSTFRPPACVAGSELFADVPAASGFCSWIEELARRGVVTGCGGGLYCPAAAVTREQMGVFLGVTFGLTLYP
jgi:CSLREA domain-containing protein